MKKIFSIILGVGLLLGGFPAFSQAAPDSPQPKIVCDAPNHDFGKRDNSEVVTHEYVIRNDGTGDLIISNVKASCGCTVAEITTKHLEPGKEAVITARFDLKGRRDKQSKHITITSNDPVNPQFILRLTGVATSEIEITPKLLSYGNVLPGEEVTKTIELKAAGERDFAVKEVSALASRVTCRLEEVTAGKHYIIHCTLPADLKVGRITDRVNILTDHPKMPKLGVTITGNVMGKLVVSPERIMLSENSTKPVTRYISVASGSVKDFEVTEATWPDDGVEVRITEMPRYGYRIQLRNVLGHRSLDGKELILKTNVKDAEQVKVPIVVRPPYPANQTSRPPLPTDAPPGSGG